MLCNQPDVSLALCTNLLELFAHSLVFLKTEMEAQ